MKRTFAAATALVMLCTLAPLPAPAEDFRTFRDDNFGFSFQLPSSWEFQVTEAKDYLFSGAPGGPAADAAILVKILPKSSNPGKSNLDILKAIWNLISQQPGAELAGDGMVPMAGAEFPFFTATYKSQAPSGGGGTFGHLQVVVDRGDYQFPLSFSAPMPAYDEHLKVFKHLAATLAFQ